MATAQVHSLLESIERELGRLGATPSRVSPPDAAARADGQPAGDGEWRPGATEY